MRKEDAFRAMTDIKFLKTKIKPDFIDKKLKPIFKPHTIKVDNGGLRPIRLYFEKVCEAYGCYVEIAKLQENSYFYYDLDLISIGLNGDFCVKTKTLLPIFYHELSHKLQRDVGYSKSCRRYYKFSFEQELEIERTAERLSYFFCKEYHSHIKWNHRKFSIYRSKKDREWLSNYLKKYS